jgi:hypothetical protein
MKSTNSLVPFGITEDCSISGINFNVPIPKKGNKVYVIIIVG